MMAGYNGSMGLLPYATRGLELSVAQRNIPSGKSNQEFVTVPQSLLDRGIKLSPVLRVTSTILTAARLLCLSKIFDEVFDEKPLTWG